MPSLGVRSPWVYLSQFSRTLEKVRIALPLGSVTLATVADENFDVKLNFLFCTPSNSSISLAQSSFSPVQLGIIPSRSFERWFNLRRYFKFVSTTKNVPIADPQQMLSF